MRKLLYIIVLLGFSVFSQEKISIGIYQDARLAFIGDDKGNEAGTLDIIARVEMQGNQQKYGYLNIFPQFEYAEIYGNYKRWSANVGYGFNQFIVNVNPYVSYGWIDRGVSFSSWGFGNELSYDIGSFEVALLVEYVERKELDKWVFSGYIGIKYNIKVNATN